jgi:deoxycytidylate deaminase
MKTSYFANRVAAADPHAVAICRGVPRWFKGRIYDPLRPSWKLLQEAKDGTISHEDYERCYRAEVLAALDPARVRQELGDDAILLCWERPDAPCHRRLVARWLEEALGLEVPEHQ